MRSDAKAILAVLTLFISFIYAVLRIIFDLYIFWLGLIASGLCLLTIFSTAMIYTQMKTVPRWNMKITPILFLLYGIAGSSIILNNALFSSLLFAILGLVQVSTWKKGDQEFERLSNIGTATGLSKNNEIVRMLEPPHTGSNYLLKEMVHIVAQKHIHKLRWISLFLLSFFPTMLCLVTGMITTNYTTIIIIIIGSLNIIGTLVSRWLFFSEAEHVVGLYYDR